VQFRLYSPILGIKKFKNCLGKGQEIVLRLKKGRSKPWWRLAMYIESSFPSQCKKPEKDQKGKGEMGDTRGKEELKCERGKVRKVGESCVHQRSRSSLGVEAKKTEVTVQKSPPNFELGVLSKISTKQLKSCPGMRFNGKAFGVVVAVAAAVHHDPVSSCYHSPAGLRGARSSQVKNIPTINNL